VKDKIGQLFFIGLQGTELLSEEAQFIVDNNIGGVILFSRNIETPKQLHKLCAEVQALSTRLPDRLPMFIGIDQEGGRVARLKAPFTQWPPLQKLGATDSTSLAFKFSLAMGKELNAMGINIDFAPCVDTLTNDKNEIIGDRAISNDPETVAKIASALVRGYIKSGIIPCAKHFPGHGNTLLDSHEELPIENVDRETLENRELLPFKKVFRARLDMLMTAHIRYTHLDSEWPATLSEKILQDLLRKECRYRNLVLSDDLDMKALTNHYDVKTIPLRALQAGCDILLYCNEFDKPPMALEVLRKALDSGELSNERIDQSYQRVLQLKTTKLSKLRYPSFEEASSLVGHPDHLRMAKAVAEGDIPEDLLTN
jgi:beta-N-acetylhexosaminidase